MTNFPTLGSVLKMWIKYTTSEFIIYSQDTKLWIWVLILFVPRIFFQFWAGRATAKFIVLAMLWGINSLYQVFLICFQLRGFWSHYRVLECDQNPLKGVLIDFIYHLLFVNLKQLFWLEFTVINYSESSDEFLLIFIVKITHLIKANQRKSLSWKSLFNRLCER